MKKYYYFANWKMFQTLSSVKSFIKDYKKNSDFLEKNEALLGIAPSYEHIYFLQESLQNSTIYTGAQDCSMRVQGAFTGQVSVQSLMDLQISFCIIGHSEVRTYLGQTDQDVFLKFKMLVAAGISPVLCIGDTLVQKESGQTFQVLFDQLESIVQFLSTYKGQTPIFVAYEPVYAIGTGIIPSLQDLETIFCFLDTIFTQIDCYENIRLIYGGSVSSLTIEQCKKISKISGFLIGKASIDFQELKKIVES